MVSAMFEDLSSIKTIFSSYCSGLLYLMEFVGKLGIKEKRLAMLYLVMQASCLRPHDNVESKVK